MWFLTLLVFGTFFWFLWLISGNTRDALDKQSDILKELKQLNQLFSHQQADNQHQASRSSTSLIIDQESTPDRPSELININTADIKTLQTLPGVGKALAQKIMDARPFTEIQSLSALSGISEEMLNKLKKQIDL